MGRLGMLAVTLLVAAAFLAFEPGLAAYPVQLKSIELSKPGYIVRKSKPWVERARLVGELKFPPDSFKLAFRAVGGDKQVKEFSFPGGLTVYVTPLLPAGSYDLAVSAQGFRTIEVKALNLKPGADCRINIAFDRED